MTDRLEETEGQVRAEKRPRRPRRVLLLLSLGLLTILAAVAFRFSPWAREYQLRRESLDALRQQAKDAPRDPLVLYYLGTKAYNAKSLGEAGYCFDTAAKLDPKMTRALVGLSIVQRDVGQWAEAYATAQKARQLAPRDLEIQFLIAMLVMHASQSRAIPEFQKVTSQDPKRADAWYWQGICEWGVNQKGEASAHLRKAVALEPKALYQRDLGELLMELGSFEEALPLLEKARGLAPNDPYVHYLLGKGRLKLARDPAALEAVTADFTQAASLLGPPDGKNVESHVELASSRAELASRLQQPEAALKYLAEARKLAPNNLQVLYQYSEALRKVGRTAESRQTMAEYQARSTLADAVYQMTERVKQDPKNPALRLEMARLFARNHDRARAINQYEYCLFLDPKQAVARKEMNALRR